MYPQAIAPTPPVLRQPRTGPGVRFGPQQLATRGSGCLLRDLLAATTVELTLATQHRAVKLVSCSSGLPQSVDLSYQRLNDKFLDRLSIIQLDDCSCLILKARQLLGNVFHGFPFWDG